MKVTRQMLHPDLRPFGVYWTALGLKYFFRAKWSMKVTTAVLSRMIKSEAPESINVEERFLPTGDGEAEIRVKIYRPASASGDLPAMLYTHGGGYVTGSPDVFDGQLATFIERRPCVIVAPAYRNALVKPYPAALDDCYGTLLWMRDNAGELGIDAGRFMIAGHSAGGGLTAAITLKARDTKDVKVAFQMPLYPMIDDRQPTDPERYIDTPGWDTRANAFGWGSYLKDLHRRNAEIPCLRRSSQEYRLQRISADHYLRGRIRTVLLGDGRIRRPAEGGGDRRCVQGVRTLHARPRANRPRLADWPGRHRVHLRQLR